jgi:hypothetical protein
MMASMVGFDGDFDESLESDRWFCVGAFGRKLASVCLKMVSHLMSFRMKLYKFCTLNATRGDNVTITRTRLMEKI